jgi:prevent-host-death family protein
MDKTWIFTVMPTLLSEQTVDAFRQEVDALPAMTASELKNNFGLASQQAAKGALAITRHNRAEFVLMPVRDYVELQRARQAPLDGLATQFDAMVVKMNTPAARRGVGALFKATPGQLGKVAAKTARTDAK